MAKTSLALSRVYQLLEPGPVVLLTTAVRDERNVMTMSWHMMMEFEPPLVGCVISGRNHSFSLLEKSRQCVINVPTREIAREVVACGNTSGRSCDKFASFGLTPRPAKRVAAPLIEECYASLECVIADRRMVTAYNMFILEVVAAWIDRSVKRPRTLHHMGRGRFAVSGDVLRLPSKMK
jgi:flavin reductase (DIM6/NTAB) family NADH-FMN oxidoreductase RutF